MPGAEIKVNVSKWMANKLPQLDATYEIGLNIEKTFSKIWNRDVDRTGAWI